MKKSKNILLLTGMGISLFSLCILIYKFIFYLSDIKASGEVFALLGGNVILYVIVISLAIVQFVRNLRNTNSLVLSVIGITISSVCLVLSVISIPSKIPQFLIYDHLGLADIRYLANTFIGGFVSQGIIGHILLIIGYTLSLQKRKQ